MPARKPAAPETDGSIVETVELEGGRGKLEIRLTPEGRLLFHAELDDGVSLGFAITPLDLRHLREATGAFVLRELLEVLREKSTPST